MTKRNTITTHVISWTLPLLLVACTERTPETSPPPEEPASAPVASVQPPTPATVEPVIEAEPQKSPQPPSRAKESPPPPEPKPTFAAVMKEAAALRAAGDSARAIERYLAAAELKPKQWRPLIAAARLLITAKQLEQARQVAKRAVEIASGSSSAWNTLGRVALVQGKLAAAERAFTRATERNESNIWAWNNLGLTRIKRKHYDAAVTALERATEGDGATAYMFNNLGIAYERATRVQEALTAYKTGLQKGSGVAGQNFVRLEREVEPLGG